MNNTMIEVSDVTMRFRMNADKIMSLKEFVTAALRGKLEYQDCTLSILKQGTAELRRYQD